MLSFRWTYKCFYISIGNLSLPGAVVPFAAWSDRSISGVVRGCHGSPSGAGVVELASGVSIGGKKESRKACALSLFSISSWSSTFSAGIQPYVSLGFM